LKESEGKKISGVCQRFFRQRPKRSSLLGLFAVGPETQLYPPSDFIGRCPEGGRYNDTERVFGIDIVSGVGGLAGPLPTEIGLLTEAKLLYLQSNSLTCVHIMFCVPFFVLIKSVVEFPPLPPAQTTRVLFVRSSAV
jgi:hypothetical protein